MGISTQTSSQDVSIEREKRRKARRAFVAGLDVREAKTGNLIGQLIDLNSCGMRLVVDYPLNSELIVPVHICLPEAVDGRDRLDVTMQSRWCHRVVNKRDYECGFRFVNTTFRQKLLLETFLKRSGLDDESLFDGEG